MPSASLPPSPATAEIAALRAFSRELAREGGLLAPDYLDSGFSLAEARALYEIGARGGTSISALAQELRLDLGYVSRVVSRLVAARLVSKSTGEDARARVLALTALGRRRLGVLAQRADAKLGAWLATVEPRRAQSLLAGVRTFLGDDRPAEPPPSSAPRIRDARPGDLGCIIARHAELYTKEYGYPSAFEHYVIAAFATLIAGQSRVHVAEDVGGHFLGSVASVDEGATAIRLRFLLVEPAARGLGLGRRLVRAVIEDARRRGKTHVVLDTASDLAAARALYTAEGFRRTRSLAGMSWLPSRVRSETWELALTPVGRGRGAAVR